MPYLPKDATPATVTANREALTRYDMDDRGDFADADAGLIALWRPTRWSARTGM